MTEYFQKNLFKDISMEEYKGLLACLDARARQFRPGDTICDYGKGFNDIGIIGKGGASVVRFEWNGARTILERLGPQDIFGYLLSCDGSNHAGISVTADSPCKVLFIHYAALSSPCAKACRRHQQLIQNLLNMISGRALNLSRRVEVLSQRTIREKLMCYFLQMAGQAKSSCFRLPFTMVELADYLCVDRSAMTRELKRMKDEHLIEIHRPNVQLLQDYARFE